MTDTPETAALALGKLIGTVEGLVRAIEEQNKTAAKTKEEQDRAAAKSRDEFMEIFKGIRNDNKEQAKLIQEHIAEDNVHHSAVMKLVAWQEEVDPKIDDLWDAQNRQKGAMVASGTIGSIIGGAFVAIIEYLNKK